MDFYYYSQRYEWNEEWNSYELVPYYVSDTTPINIKEKVDLPGRFCDKVRLVMCEARRKIARIFTDPNIENLITQEEFEKLNEEFDRLSAHIERYDKWTVEHTITYQL